LGLAAILYNGGVPFASLVIVGRKVLTRYAKENMVINPFGKGANALGTEDVCGCVCELAVDSASRGKAEIVACVDGK
jgi:hypothetical protein